MMRFKINHEVVGRMMVGAVTGGQSPLCLRYDALTIRKLETGYAIHVWHGTNMIGEFVCNADMNVNDSISLTEMGGVMSLRME